MTFSIAIDALMSIDMSEPCGRIVVSDWQEPFLIAPVSGHPRPEESFEGLWRSELTRLINGAPAVVLPTQPGRGWVLYREDDHVYVQEQLFMVPDEDGELVLDASTFAIQPRETISDEGDEISEWATTVQAIKSFLESCAA